MEQMPSNTPVMESKPGSAGLLPIWIKAVTKPSEQTFIEISESVDATQKTAFIWIFIAGTISGIFEALTRGIRRGLMGGPSGLLPGIEEYLSASGSGDVQSTLILLVVTVCASPLIGLLTVLFFAIWVAILQWIAKLLGGSGTFEKLAYSLAAIFVPVTLVTAVVSLFSFTPYVGGCFAILSSGLTLYSIYLQIVAVKAVNRFSWGPALGTVLIPAIVIGLVCGCLFIVGMMFFAPNMLGDIYLSLTH